MAVVNLETGKIVGAEEGTLTYYHEQGHLAFINTTMGLIYNYCAEAEIKWIVVLLSINLWYDYYFLKVACSILAFSMVYFYIFEELWCWNFAFKKRGRI